MQSATGVEISSLCKSFSGFRAIDDVTLSIAPGEFVSLLGPSGCGKTTLLRAVAGLVVPDTGSIRIGTETVVDAASRTFVPAERRRLGMVFQDYALWPHMRVRENVAFPLAARGVAAAAHDTMMRTALRRVGLESLAERFPGELSGGQQQRVALARAIVDTPRLLLFDEPLSNLDAGLRDALGREIARMVRELGATAIYVTHDQSEALSLSDRIALMRGGRIVCADTPEQLYREPPDAWVARFLNVGNLISGDVGQGVFQATGAEERVLLPELINGHAGPSTLLLPSSAILVGAATPDFHLAVSSVHFRGDRYEVAARWSCPEHGPLLHFWHDRPLRPGERIPVSLDRNRLRLFIGGSGGSDI
jgi:iron(III) transport system ATP-binding protein